MADPDPFADARSRAPILKCRFAGEEIPLLLQHADVKKAAKDWQQFSSDAPFRVPIPSEEAFRKIRQLPIETDPPLHGEYRKLVEPFFKRAHLPEVRQQMQALWRELIQQACQQSAAESAVEVVAQLALPAQSRALTYLLAVPEQEAELWTSWGLHVFGDKKGATTSPLDDYLSERFARATSDSETAAPETAACPDFFSSLTRAQFQGRSLSKEELLGFGNLVFAGGRDTIIHTISGIIHHLATHPQALAFLREDPKRIPLAAEEYFRVASPLTHIGRVCPHETEVHGCPVAANERIALGWASANHDGEVFQNPQEVNLARKPNPHLAFGSGPHFCLGAAHARLVMRSLLEVLCEEVASFQLLAAEPLIEKEEDYQRANGFHRLEIRFCPLAGS